MRTFVLHRLGFIAVISISCAHTPPATGGSDVTSVGPRLFRCVGQFDIESREIRGFVDVDRSVTYFQSWAYEAGQAFEKLRKQKLLPQHEAGKQFIYDVSSSLGEMRFTLPGELYGVAPNSGWKNSTYSRFSSNLTYSLPTSPKNEVTVPMKCAMWTSKDYSANYYDEATEGREVHL